jgi:hypothetical protein
MPGWPADRVERWPIERLIPYAKNSRSHSDARASLVRRPSRRRPATLLHGVGKIVARQHRRAIEQGIAHFAGLPYVRVAGDTAFAISYIQILVPDGIGPVFEVPNQGSSQGFHVHRVAANRWEFVRTEAGWKIRRRTVRSLDGSPPACEILRGALEA